MVGAPECAARPRALLLNRFAVEPHRSIAPIAAFQAGLRVPGTQAAKENLFVRTWWSNFGHFGMDGGLFRFGEPVSPTGFQVEIQKT